MHRICNFDMNSPNISQENKAAKAGKVKNRKSEEQDHRGR
jgi:hypothetical protein